MRSKRTKTNLRRCIQCFLFICIVSLFLTVIPSGKAYAAGYSSWRPDNSEEIYKPDNSSTSKATDILQKVNEGITGVVGGVLTVLLMPVILVLAYMLDKIILSGGISFDSIIYGRVGGSGYIDKASSTNLSFFTFELTKGNIYGSVATIIYNILLSFFVILILCVVLFRLTMLLYSGGDSKSRASFKTTIQTAAISLAAIFLMPKFLDFALYLRDLVLYTIRDGGSNAISQILNGKVPSGSVFSTYISSTADKGLMNMYRSSCTGSLFNAIMYLGSTILTLYLAFTYVSIALTFSILYIMFPFVCVMQAAGGGSRLKDWINQVLGLMLIPIIDAVLLFFPIAFSALLNHTSDPGPFTLIEFALIAAIVPARGFIRQQLGFGSASALERSGLGAAIGAARLGMSVAGAVSKLGMANRERNTEADSMDTLAQVNNSLVTSHESEAAKHLDAFAAATEDVKDKYYNGIDKDGIMNQMKTEGLSGTKKISREKAAIENNLSSIDSAIAKHEKDKQSDLKKISKLDEELGLLNEQKQKAHQEGNTDTPDIDMLITKNSAKIKRLNNSIKKHEGSIQALGNLKRIGQTKLTSLAAIGGDIDPQEQAILDSHATIENFMDPEFRDISPERRSVLATERAAELRKLSARATVTGAAGTIYGGVLAGGIASFMSPSAVMTSSSLGIDIGNSIAQSSVQRQYIKDVRAQASAPVPTEPEMITVKYQPYFGYSPSNKDQSDDTSTSTGVTSVADAQRILIGARKAKYTTQYPTILDAALKVEPELREECSKAGIQAVRVQCERFRASHRGMADFGSMDRHQLDEDELLKVYEKAYREHFMGSDSLIGIKFASTKGMEDYIARTQLKTKDETKFDKNVIEQIHNIGRTVL